MQDAWRAYLELALGLTEASRKRAQTVARKLVGSSGATAAQLQTLAEELVSTGLANREALTKIIRFEVDRALGAVGLATADEVAELTNRVRQLERELQEAKAAAATSVAPAGEREAGSAVVAPASPAVKTTPAKKTVAKKTVAKKAPAKKAVLKKTAAKKAGASLGSAAAAEATTGTIAPAKQGRKLPPTTKRTLPAKRTSARKLPPGTGAA